MVPNIVTTRRVKSWCAQHSLSHSEYLALVPNIVTTRQQVPNIVTSSKSSKALGKLWTHMLEG